MRAGCPRAATASPRCYGRFTYTWSNTPIYDRGWAHAVCEGPPEQHTAACFDAGGAQFERGVLCVCRAVDAGVLSAQAVAYLESQGAVLDLAAQEIDTKGTRAAGRAW